jgi:hypothetical protein
MVLRSQNDGDYAYKDGWLKNQSVPPRRKTNEKTNIASPVSYHSSAYQRLHSVIDGRKAPHNRSG